MEDLLAKIALTAITIFCFGIVAWLFKRWLDAENKASNLKIDTIIKKQDEINGSVKDVIDRHHACREELPEKYATKNTVDKIFNELKPIPKIQLDVKHIIEQIEKKEKEIAQQT